jgi:tellurite resistance protein
MEDSARAMATWLGALRRSGVVHGADAEAGEGLAAFVLGERRLDELQTWLAHAHPEEIEREKQAAIEVCIWMAHADRVLEPEERALLREIIDASGLSDDVRAELTVATLDPPSLRGLDRRLRQPVLKELLLALAWELAMADGRVTRAESDFYRGLAARLGVPVDRAEAIREAIASRVG